jgi:MFS family permease
MLRWHLDLTPLYWRDFRLLFCAQTTSVFGDFLVPVAIAFGVLEISGSGAALGLVFAAALLPSIPLYLVGGIFADRARRRSVMLAADLVRALSQGVLATLLIAGQAEVWHFVVLQSVRGAASAFFGPALTGLLPEIVRPAHLQAANALQSLTQATAAIIAPAISGVLVAFLGAGWALAIDAGTFAVSALFLAMLRPAALQRRLELSGMAAELAEGWHAFSERSWLWLSIGFFALFNVFAYAPFMVLGPLIADRSLEGAPAWGTVLAASGVGSLVGGLVALGLQPTRPLRLAIALFALYGLQTTALAVPAPVVVLAGAAMVGSFGITVANTLRETVLQQRVPQDVISRVSSYDWLSYSFAPLGYIIVGLAVDSIGPAPLLAAATVWIVAMSILVASLPAVRHLENLGVSGHIAAHPYHR